MQVAGISHRALTPDESARVETLEQWLLARGARLDLANAYVHAKTTSPEGGGVELHMPLRQEPDLAWVLELDLAADTLTSSWGLETDGPEWPDWTARTSLWRDWRSVVESELARRIRVTPSRIRSSGRLEIEKDLGVWVTLRKGRVVGRESTVFTLGP